MAPETLVLEFDGPLSFYLEMRVDLVLLILRFRSEHFFPSSLSEAFFLAMSLGRSFFTLLYRQLLLDLV